MEGNWVTEKIYIERLFVNHFLKVSESTSPTQSCIIEELFPAVITSANNDMLIAMPTDEEINLVIRHLKSEKAPGPDGFSPAFFQDNWEIVEKDMVNMVKDFFHSKVMLKEMNHTNITLIPKTKSPQHPTDFRPISLCNSTYKVISKLLANRLKPLLDDIISPYQAAFVPGRHISDNITIAHEIVHSMNTMKGKQKYMGLKLDMSKAFDRIEWSFLIQILRCLGFSQHFCTLIYQCISTVSMSVLINGEPSSPFHPTRGVRQGDPLSPYLFIICMEAMSRMLANSQSKGLIQGFKQSQSSPIITHLLFADDCLIFTKIGLEQTHNLLDVLTEFGRLSGQMINFQKSGIFFSSNTPLKHGRIVSRILRVQKIDPKDKYLGATLFIKKSKIKCFSFLVDRLSQKINNWKSKLLSQAGKAELISSSLQASPKYQMSVFEIPRKIIHDMVSLQRDFWWGRSTQKKGIVLKAWKDLAKHKHKGGLGFRDLALDNEAMLTKQLWKLKVEPNSLWSRFFKAKYYPHGSIRQSKTSGNSWFWRCLRKRLDQMESLTTWEVGNGKDISIWNHSWIPNQLPLGEPSGGSRYQTVDQLITFTGNWNYSLLTELFSNETVMNILAIPLYPGKIDQQRWSLTQEGEYTVSSMYKYLTRSQSIELHDMSYWKKIWSLDVTPRIKIFLWKLTLNILPLSPVVGKYLCLQDMNCPLCNTAEETWQHLVCDCPFTRSIIYSLPQSIRLDMLPHDTFQQLFVEIEKLDEAASNTPLPLSAMISIRLWYIWKARCEKVFQGKQPQQSELLDRIIQLTNTIAKHKLPSQQSNPAPEAIWIPPPQDFVKCNFDVSFKSSVQEAAIGLIIHNPLGVCIAGKSILIRCRSVDEGEALAAHEA